MKFNHIPVLLKEVAKNLAIKKDGIYVDATIGGGGHSSEIIRHLTKDATLIGIDKDEFAINFCKEKFKDAKPKVILVHDDFKNIRKILEGHKIKAVDGFLLDLGMSSYQIDTPSRGFTYLKDAPLDMRMDTSQSLTASDVVNTYSEEKLVKILYDYGEEKFAKSIAKNIVKARSIKPITRTLELVKVVESSMPAKVLHKGGNVAKKTFQAIRIEVNGELNSLKTALEDMVDMLRPGGRLCVITFHSLEDKIVKKCFAYHCANCICPKSFPVCVCHHKADSKFLSKKKFLPSKEEIEKNPRSSSAKLRVIEKI